MIDTTRPGLRVVPAVAGATLPQGNESNVEPNVLDDTQKPKNLAKLSAAERRVWNYLVRELQSFGRAYSVTSMSLTVLVRIYVQWRNIEDQLAQLIAENSGSFMVKTPNGFDQPHQLYYVAKDLKRQLLQWQSEMGLTMPVFAKLQDGDQAPTTPDMFEDPVTAFRAKKKAINGTGAPQG